MVKRLRELKSGFIGNDAEFLEECACYIEKTEKAKAEIYEWLDIVEPGEISRVVLLEICKILMK